MHTGTALQVTVNDLPIGRSVDETLRTLQAIQYHAAHGEVRGGAPGGGGREGSTGGMHCAGLCASMHACM